MWRSQKVRFIRFTSLHVFYIIFISLPATSFQTPFHFTLTTKQIIFFGTCLVVKAMIRLDLFRRQSLSWFAADSMTKYHVRAMSFELHRLAIYKAVVTDQNNVRLGEGGSNSRRMPQNGERNFPFIAFFSKPSLPRRMLLGKRMLNRAAYPAKYIFVNTRFCG